MRVLVDLHALLWYVHDDPQLGRQAREVLRTQEHSLILSAANLWELAIKVSNRKLKIGEPLDVFIERITSDLRLEFIGISRPHVLRVATLPFHHKDPFDRLLIAQSLTEGLPVVTHDAAFARYGVDLIW